MLWDLVRMAYKQHAVEKGINVIHRHFWYSFDRRYSLKVSLFLGWTREQTLAIKKHFAKQIITKTAINKREAEEFLKLYPIDRTWREIKNKVGLKEMRVINGSMFVRSAFFNEACNCHHRPIYRDFLHFSLQTWNEAKSYSILWFLRAPYSDNPCFLTANCSGRMFYIII